MYQKTKAALSQLMGLWMRFTLMSLILHIFYETSNVFFYIGTFLFQEGGDRVHKKFITIVLALTLMLSVPYIAHGASMGEITTSTKADSIISYGKRFLGTPYLFGAKPYAVSHKFDCSSFTKYVFAHYGISLPRVSRDQAKRGHYVSKSNLRKGDLVFFYVGNNKGRIGHVGIYAGNGQMLHTYGEGGVKFTSIYRDYWKDRYITARRVIN